MLGEFYPKSLPDLNNMPKNSKFASNIYTSWWDWSENIFNINFKESISFECPYPVIFRPFGILAICLTYK